MNSKQKNILLWNPISNHGHLNMYLELYADCLIQLGYNVLYYADLDAEFEAYLKVELPKLRSVEAIVTTKNLKRWSFSWVYFVGKNLTTRNTMPPIKMYTTAVCPYCNRAKQILKARGVEHIEEVRIDLSPDERDRMMALTGRRTVPQIFIGETHVGGCDDLMALDSRGGLMPLLQAS